MSAATVQQIFKERLLTIPDYQRGYAWERRQVTDFLDDLALLPAGKVHYTGTLILHPQLENHVDEEATTYSVVHVVDGQQRLTTIVMLLVEIAHAMRVLDRTTLADGVLKSYRSCIAISGQPLLRLRLNHDTNHYWEQVVVADEPAPHAPTTGAEVRLRAARRQLHEHLDERAKELGDAYPDWLLGLLQTVTQQLQFTVYEVDDAAEVGVIFETMNDRGAVLSQLEKVKNFLLYTAARLSIPSNDLGATVNNTWSRLLAQLGSANLTKPSDENELLRAHWLVTHDPSPRRFDGFTSIKQRFALRPGSDQRALLADIVTYLRGLEDAAVALCDIRRPDRPGAFEGFDADSQARRRIIAAGEKLSRIGALATVLPLLVAARLAKGTDADVYSSVVESCELFAFRVYRLAERRSNAGETDLAIIAHMVAAGKVEPPKLLPVYIQQRAKVFAPDERIRSLAAARHDWYSWDGLRYMLYEYEEHLARKGPVKVSWSDIVRRDLDQSIEHIYPQTATDSYWQSRFPTAVEGELVHDLGNLVLTFNNSSYRNKAYPAKCGAAGTEQACYATSQLKQEQELPITYPEWDPAAVVARRERLLAWAYHRWDVAANHAEPDLEVSDEMLVPLATIPVDSVDDSYAHANGVTEDYGHGDAV